MSSSSLILPPGATLGGFEIEDVLGIGGMAVVYRAMQLSLGRRVALKVLNPRLAADATFRERFRREGALVAALDHPNVIPVYDFGEADGRLYLAMRLVDGVTLSDRMIDAPLSTTETLAMVAAVGSALDAAHEGGLLHRDVKPQNILLSHTGAVYLADFGVAKMAGSDLTHTGGFLGSVTYVSPEHIRGDAIGPPTDVYALATVAYECLSGRAPFRRDTEASVIHAHLSDPPPPLDPPGNAVSAAVSDVLSHGLQKDPSDRPQSAGDFVASLTAALRGASADVLGRRPGFPRGATETGAPSAEGADAPAPAPEPTVVPDVAPVADPLRDRGDHTIHDRRRDELVREEPQRNDADLLFRVLPVLALLVAIAVPLIVWSAAKKDPVPATAVGPVSLAPIAGWASQPITALPESEAFGLELESGRRWRSPSGKATVVVGELAKDSRLSPTRLGDAERVAQVKVPAGTLRRWSIGDPSLGPAPGATTPEPPSPATPTTPGTDAEASLLRSVAVGLTDARPVVILCAGPPAGVKPVCDAAVASLRPAQGKLASDPDGAVASALAAAIAGAERVRSRTLLPSKDRTVRARRASQLAKAYATAAAAVRKTAADRPWDRDLRQVASALGSAATAYKRIASAAGAKDRTRDQKAREALRAADRGLSTALGRLGRRGYAARAGT